MSGPELLRGLVCVAALSGAIVVLPGCEVGMEGADYPVAYGEYPDGCIATTEAVYYNGYPSYWCGGFWHFRVAGGRWGHYDREPPALAQHRMQGAPARRNYERGARPIGGGRGGGGRGGGGRGGHR